MPQREKEEASDYRYFPEPDLPPILTGEGGIDVEKISKEIKILPRELHKKLVENDVPKDVAEKIVTSSDHAGYILDGEKIEKEIALFITEEVNNQINHHKITYEEYKQRVPISNVSELLNLVKSGKISRGIAKEVFSEMVQYGKKAYQIIEERGLEQVSDDSKIIETVSLIIEQHAEELLRYRAGEKQLVGYFMGLVMREMGGRANPEILRKKLLEKLEEND